MAKRLAERRHHAKHGRAHKPAHRKAARHSSRQIAHHGHHEAEPHGGPILYYIGAIVLVVVLVAMIPFIAPIVLQPPGQFVTPIQISSSNYGAAVTPTSGSGTSQSGSYVSDVIAGQPAGGSSQSTSYKVDYGVQTFLFPVAVVTGAPLASEQQVTPASGATYSPTQVYTFKVKWTPAPGRTIAEVQFELKKGTQVISTRRLSLGEVTLAAGLYQTSFTGLAGSGYTYKWIAQDSTGATNEAIALYDIVPQSTTTSITINGAPAGPAVTVEPGTVNVAVSSSQASLPVVLFTNFTGPLAAVKAGNGSLTYDFNTLQVGGLSWLVQASTTANENYSASTAGTVVRLKTPTAVTLAIDGKAQSVVYPLGTTSASLSASVNAPGEAVCINVITAAGANETPQCASGSVTKSEILSTSIAGAYKLMAYFAGSAQFAASAKVLYLVVGTDALFPTWSSLAQPGPPIFANQTISVSAALADDTFVHTATLQTNVTGTFQNVASQYVGAPSADVSFSFSTGIVAEAHAWRIMFNDSAGNQNATDASTFRALPPTPANVTIFTSPPGVDITLDGIIIGTSPVTASLGPGSHTINFGSAATFAPPQQLVIQINASNVGTVLSPINVTYYDPSDVNKDRTISPAERDSAVTAWKTGTIAMGQLITTIGRWKAGSY
jgi:hypothetical protein